MVVYFGKSCVTFNGWINSAGRHFIMYKVLASCDLNMQETTEWKNQLPSSTAQHVLFSGRKRYGT